MNAMLQYAVWKQQPLDFEKEYRIVKEREERCRRKEAEEASLKTPTE